MKKVALVLSGGGAKGAFQAGAIKYIYEEINQVHPDWKYEVYSGVSVGCLNACMLGQGKYRQMLEIWQTVDNHKVFTGKIKLLPALWRIIRGKKGILGYEPLYKIIKDHMRLKDLEANPSTTLFGTVSLTNGAYHSFSAPDFADDNNLQKAILASALMPIFWPPVPDFDTLSGRQHEMVDGGLRDTSPLGDVLGFDPDLIIIINTQPFSASENLPLKEDPNAGKNIFTIAKRSLVEITVNEVFLTDLREFLTINNLVQQATAQNATLLKRNGKPYKYYEPVLICPEEDLGDVLDFSPALTKQRMELGYKAAELAFKKMENETPQDPALA